MVRTYANPFIYLDCFIAIQGMPEEQRNYAIKQVLCMLPKLNLMLLISLCDFLKEIVQVKTHMFLLIVSKHKEKNKMTPENLAICFAPNLLRPQTDCKNKFYLFPTF